MCTRIVEAVGWTRAPKLIGVHVNALTSCVIARREIITPDWLIKRLTMLGKACAYVQWRTLVAPRYVYDACGDEQALRPLATYLGIGARYMRQPISAKTWTRIAALVRIVRAEILAYIPREYEDSLALYTYYPECERESNRVQDARDHADYLAERSRLADMKLRATQEQSAATMQSVGAQG